MESNPTRSFTLFPRLPTELRLKIWHLAMPGPRTITLQYKFRRRARLESALPYTASWTSKDLNPAALQVCHESRYEALEIYEQAFGTHACSGRKVYFDFEQDTLKFGGEENYSESDGILNGAPGYIYPAGTTDWLGLFLSGDYLGGDHDGEKKLKRLVIAISWDFLVRRAFIWHDIRNFTNLMEVTILADRSEADEIMQAGAARSFHFLAREHKEWNPPKVLIGDPASGTVWEEFGPEAV